MPPPNAQRRRALTDAAIELVALSGLHGLTHRSVDRQAGVPAGTASNYFPTRDALLIGVMERVWELHHNDMQEQEPLGSRTHHGESLVRSPRRTGRATLLDAVELIAVSLVEAATTHRDRYAAMYEIQSEIRRRPELSGALARLQADSAGETSAYHAARGLPIPPEAVPSLQALYGGALLALLSMHAAQVTMELARPLAQAMVYGVRRRPSGGASG